MSNELPNQPAKLSELLCLCLYCRQLCDFSGLANLYLSGIEFPFLVQDTHTGSILGYLFGRILSILISVGTVTSCSDAGNASFLDFLYRMYFYGFPDLYCQQLKLCVCRTSFYRLHLRRCLYAAYDGLPRRSRTAVQPACPTLRILHQPGA